MGNGVATGRNCKPSPEVDALHHVRKNSPHDSRTRNEEYEYLKSVVMRLKKELADLEVKYGALQTELLQTQKELHVKESEVVRLQREIHKLKVWIVYVIEADAIALFYIKA